MSSAKVCRMFNAAVFVLSETACSNCLTLQKSTFKTYKLDVSVCSSDKISTFTVQIGDIILMTKHLFLIVAVLFVQVLNAQTRQWTVADGLPSDEIRQIIELPNGQMLVGCEGNYSLTAGERFYSVDCNRRHTIPLDTFSTRYAHLWQGDSLLWLHDLYRVYLFDIRTRTFRNDIVERARNPFVADFMAGRSGFELVADELWPAIDSLGLHSQCMTAIRDRQGGLWIGTRDRGIVYKSPRRMSPQQIQDATLMKLARHGTNSRIQLPELPYRRVNFTCDLPDGRVLIGYDLNHLSYFRPAEKDILPIDNLQLTRFRNIVGACPIDGKWTVLYAQNGIVMLDTEVDTIAAFPTGKEIEHYTEKYNCVIRDGEGCLWIGTQNGLFKSDKGDVLRVEGLYNNCIRSLVLDAEGCVWAGTSCGISRITPSVINWGGSDGIPPVGMMERAACLTDSGLLVFAHGSECTVFRPEWLYGSGAPQSPQLLTIGINGHNRLLTYGQPVLLRYNENYLTLQFSTLDYAHDAPPCYRYRLTPLETEWHEAVVRDGAAVASYTALSPGKYVFETQAATFDGKWTDSTKQMFVISPPFWLSWWARLIYLVMTVMAVTISIAVYLKRKRRQLERENDNRVNRLFERREEARHQFAENTRIDPKKIGVNSEEEELVAQLLKAIEAHITDSEYSVDQLASDVAMSRSRLYDKMRNMLGISPADFIRNVRLKRAAQMLADTSLSIAEISERVGFATARNFSQQFKKMFGLLPSEYRSSSSGQC